MSAPQLQVAFDVQTSARALAVLAAIGSDVDVIEAGTVLCLSEGLDAVTRLRAAHPGKPLVADIRIARAGKKFADLAFEAGADRVTVTGESPHDVVAGATASANEHGGCVEVELGPDWTGSDVQRWRGLGVASIIVHRRPGVPAADDVDTQKSLARLAELDTGSMAITLAGGLDSSNLHVFSAWPVDLLVVGSSLVGAPEPRAELARIRQALGEYSGGR